VDPYHHYYLIQQKILLMVVIKLLKNSLTKKVAIIGFNLGAQKYLFVFTVIIKVNINKPMLFYKMMVKI
jgi:hypothetical protein